MLIGSGEERRLIVEVRWGASAGRKAVCSVGQVLKIGRTEPADLLVPDDVKMFGLHFELAWDGVTCRLRDMNSETGTFLGGQRVEKGEVASGGWIRAGMTDFSVYFEEETPPPEPHASETASLIECKERVLSALNGMTEPLFAVVDAARDERTLVLLRESVEEYRSLYEGPRGEAMAEVAPYLVRLPRDSRLLGALVREGWGKSWGIFLTSDRPFHEMRRHLRKFLMVQDGAGRELYFRFYDPRVMRAFLPSCRPEQLLAFFEGTRAYWVEGIDGTALLGFSARERVLAQEVLPLDME